jgi:N-acetylmuramoyl-L-alanine amidase
MRNFDRKSIATVLAISLFCAVAPPRVWAASARVMYENALAREKAVRRTADEATLDQLRRAVAAYQRVVNRYPSSGYSDNALWQAAGLAKLAYERFGQDRDRELTLALLKRLRREYPSSSLIPRISATVRSLDAPRAEARAAAPPPPAPPPAPAPALPAPVAMGEDRSMTPATVLASTGTVAAPGPVATLREIQRSALSSGVRVVLQFDREVSFTETRLDGPPRMFLDFKGARPADGLLGSKQYPGDVVPEIRLGRHKDETTRVVMALAGVGRYTMFALYDPYRLIIDFVRGTPPPAPVPAKSSDTATIATTLPKADSRPPVPAPLKTEPLPAIPRELPPAVPATNVVGGFSLARQLGLGVSRVVIDPGHGGHDPGAHAGRLNESELVLDVALRVEKLLLARNFEVVLTRRTDVFIPLEDRTALANRQQADLFLSIHANASGNTKARGVETYFLNFASNPEAEALAARENATSARGMHSLPEIVRAITLNNKLDESRDFAGLVQRAMVKRLTPANRSLRDLGVKQAPFVVLIGAAMPSVLAEISFLSNRNEGALLRTPAYRQRIAEALADAIMQYQGSLKKVASLAQ